MEPLALTDRVASGAPPERTPPAMCPSRCSPPWNSTSPCTRAALPISVSMRAGLDSRVNMLPPMAPWEFPASGSGLDVPQERLRERRHVTAARAHLDVEPFGLEARRQAELLVEALQVAEVVTQLALSAGGEGREIERARALGRRAVEAHLHVAGDRRIGPSRAHQRHVDDITRRGRSGGDAPLPDLDADARGSLRHHAAVERQLLRLARYLRLQVAHGARHLRLLARAAHAEGVELGEPGAHLAVGLLGCSICTSSSVRCCATAWRS